jgi:hypothetical protein
MGPIGHGHHHGADPAAGPPLRTPNRRCYSSISPTAAPPGEDLQLAADVPGIAELALSLPVDQAQAAAAAVTHVWGSETR